MAAAGAKKATPPATDEGLTLYPATAPLLLGQWTFSS